MKVLVCGGRDFDNYELLKEVLNKLEKKDLSIIHGYAMGADKLALDWSVLNKIPCMGYSVDWEKYGKSAGPIRNKQMLEEGKPDLVIAFPGGKGTANMIKQATLAGIYVDIIKDSRDLE